MAPRWLPGGSGAEPSRAIDVYGADMTPSLVEWDLTGDEDSGFGAVVFLSATPIRIVKDFDPTLEWWRPLD